jgi:hypothetical protein
MRIPQTSQKSSLGESCPLGHTAIAASRMPGLLRPDRLGGPDVESHFVGVLDLSLQPVRSGFHVDDVYYLGQQFGRALVTELMPSKAESAGGAA